MADLASLRISVDSREIKRATADLNQMSDASNQSTSATNGLQGASSQLGFALKAVGIASFSAAMMQAVAAATQFGRQMAEINTLIDTSQVSIDELNNLVREQAILYGGNTTEQAKALYQIISAGASNAAQATATLNAANQLAIGGVTDVATAADGLTSVMNAYGNRIASVGDASDAMFMAVRAGKTTIAELSSSLGTVAPLAAEMGVTFDELVGSVAALTKGGISTNVAVTGLRAILATVVAPTKEAADMAADLGIEFSAAGIQAVGFTEFMKQLKVATGGSQEKMATLFGGVEALVPALALAGQAGEDLNAIMADMTGKTGATSDAVDLMSQTFDFQLNTAIAKANDMVLSLGNAIQTVLLPVLIFLNENMDLITAAFLAATVMLAGYAAQLAITALLSSPLIAVIASMTAQFGLLAGAQVAAAAATAGMTTLWRGFTAALLANPFTLVLAGLAAITAAIYTLSSAQRQAKQDTVNLFNSLQDLARQNSANYGVERAKAEESLRVLREQRDQLEVRIIRRRRVLEEGGMDVNTINRTLGAQEAVANNMRGQIVLLERQARVADQAKNAAEAASNVEQTATAVTVEATSATRERNRGLTDAEKLAQDNARAVQSFIDALTEEVATIGMTEQQLRQYNVQQMINIAANQKEIDLINELSAAREEALANKAIADAQEAHNKALGEGITAVEDAMAAQRAYGDMIGQSGIKLRQSQIAEDRRVKMLELERDGLLALSDEWNAFYDLLGEQANQETILDKETAKAEELRKQLQGCLGVLDDILGTDGAIGNLFNDLETQFPDFFKKMGKDFKSIAKSFGLDLGEAMQGMQMGAKMGEMFAGASKAVGLPSSKMGGQIGGAIGGMFGPVGAAIGSVVGSVGVGLVKGVKKASATIEIQAANQVTQTVKGNKSLQEAATGMANSLIDGLKQIADALGGELLAGMKISIGQRGSSFRVDPLGLGRTKGMEKFKTEEEAIAYAMKLALEKGVIQGISESAQRLLAAGNELQDAIEKAVLFEGVFDRLQQKLDPVGFSLEKLDKEFKNLRAVFNEAGASAAEYASLEQLYALERTAIIKDANKEQISALQETADSMKALSDSLREFRDSLFGANAGVANYQSALVDLIRIGSLAATGDAAALNQLQGVSETFLGASRARAKSLFEFQRDAALVANYVDQGIAAADAQVSAAQQQIDLLGSQLDQLQQINDKLGVAIGETAVTTGSASMIFDANQSGSSVLTGSTEQQLSTINATLSDGLYTIAKNTGGTYKVLDQWDGDGQPDIRELSSDYY